MWQLVLLKRGQTPAALETYYQKAYKAWQDVWGPIHKEKGAEDLFSDEFTRQDEVVTIFHDENCAAILFLNRVNLEKIHWQQDSYFSPWPEEAIAGLVQEGPNIQVCSNFTVTKNYRKENHPGVPNKELIVLFSALSFLESGYNAMTGNMRNRVGVQKVAYKLNATPLMQNVEYKGEQNDLVAWFKNNVRDLKLAPVVQNLWDNRIDSTRGFTEHIQQKKYSFNQETAI